jgi:hypothetical protein
MTFAGSLTIVLGSQVAFAAARGRLVDAVA